MNAYFDREANFDTNKRIIEAYFTDVSTAPSRAERAMQAILSFLFACWKILTGEASRRIFKALSLSLSLVGLIGIIGAMERGTLSLAAGLLIGSLLVGIEYLCLRPRHS